MKTVAQNRKLKSGLLILGHILMIGALAIGKRLPPDVAIHWRTLLACFFATGIIVTASAAYHSVRRGFTWLQERTQAQSPWTMGIVLLIWVLVGIVLMQQTQLIRQDEVTGDEPEYIMLSRSMLDERDFTLDVDIATGVCSEFMSGHFNLRGKSLRPPGLPIFLIPAYLAGRHLPWPELPFSLFLWMGLIYVWLGMELFLLIQAATRRPRLAWFTTLVAMLLPPIAPYAFQIYPELPAAVLLLRLFRREFYGDNQRNRILDGVFLALIPLFHQKYMFLFIMSGMHLAAGIFLHDRKKTLNWIALVLPSAISLTALTIFFGHRFNIWLPTAPYSLNDNLLKNLFTLHTVKIVLAQFVDRKWGMLMVSPLMLFILPGIVALWRRRPFVWVWWFATCGGFIVLLSAYSLWWGGFSPPGRFLLPVIPLLWFGAAQFWANPRSLDRPALTLIVPLLILSVFFGALMMFGTPFQTQNCSPYLYPEEAPQGSALWAAVTGWFDWNQIFPAMERNNRWNHILPDEKRFGTLDWVKTVLLMIGILLITYEFVRKTSKNPRTQKCLTTILCSSSGLIFLILMAWYQDPGIAIRSWHQSQLISSSSHSTIEPVTILNAYGPDSREWLQAPGAKYGIFYPPIYVKDEPSAQWPGGYTYRFQTPVLFDSEAKNGAVVLEVENLLTRNKQQARFEFTEIQRNHTLQVELTVPITTGALFKIVLYGDKTAQYKYRPVSLTIQPNPFN